MRCKSRLVPWALLVPVLGCKESRTAEWVSLAGDPIEPAANRAAAVLPDGQRVHFEESEGELWGRVTVDREDWKATELPNVLSAPAPLLGLGRPAYRLEIDGVPCTQVSSILDGTMKLKKSFVPGAFGYWRGSIFLGVAAGGAPPEKATLHVRIDLGAADSRGFQRLHGRRFSGKGLAAWPGLTIERVLDIPADSALRFASCTEPASSLEKPLARSHVFRILLDGEPIFEHHQAFDPSGSYAWHVVPLPERRRARLAFEVEGPFAYTSFLDPVLGPAEIGAHGARPRPSRPSIVVFLADTFRADNLASYGGPAGLTPELDRFAEQSLRFAHAWSTGTFTLPSHSSLFSGLYPRQTSATRFDSALPEEVETIAEVLARAGYRTGAITDSVVVSLRYGLHQGFAWFDECDLELDSTLERARSFLDADDGRPVFLFVHTYRTHQPYRAAEPPTPAGEPLRGLERFHGVMGRLNALGAPEEAFARDPARARALAGELLELYRHGVSDLDRGFGRFWRDLSARGFLEEGYVIFTSDHGEAFFEHGQLAHQGRVFEEQLRIPLLIAGPGIVPRTIELPSSLVDLPPTLAAMAGIAPLPAWVGTNVLALDHARALFAFECASTELSTVAILRGAKKVIAHEKTGLSKLEEPWQAFDLARDPHETEDVLADANASWPGELFRSAAPIVDTLLVPLVSGEASALDADRIEELRALGYAAE